jgi:hypothetical protein
MQDLTVQYTLKTCDTYNFMANQGLIGSCLRVHTNDIGYFSQLIQCRDIVLTDTNRGLSALPNVGHQIVHVKITGIIRSSPYSPC